MRVHSLKIAFATGVFFAVVHFGWALLVYLGLAQSLLDFVFWIHFIAPPFRIEPFEAERAGMLIAVTGAIGWVFGLAAGLIWNLFRPKS